MKTHTIFLLFAFAPLLFSSQKKLEKAVDITEMKPHKKIGNIEWIPKVTLPAKGTTINVHQPVSVRGTGVPGATIMVHPLWIWNSKTRRSAANSPYGGGSYYTRVKENGTWEVYPAFNTNRPDPHFGTVQYFGIEVTQIDDTYKTEAQTILLKYKIYR